MNTQPFKIIETEHRETLTVEEAARRLRIHTSTYYEGVRRGELPGAYVGKRVVIPFAAFERFMESGRMPTQTTDRDAIARMLIDMRKLELTTQRDILDRQIEELG